jgi:hypothetical protein
VFGHSWELELQLADGTVLGHQYETKGKRN